ncbi:D-glycero-beta-D-manno-heptose 1,7-bisphosphate 7-phosphatase [Ferrimonas balearica]|uniref:D-glycero-beta-D-manno-heptose 1,7-bisphosphate 7-phosphatase n=1 Tax=Ferrimonas balearica TaxID=44012 RepID=UPI001C5596C8|nr:D-glycero-beta-D-manno-heptose 1,7-bisphosphate 7-phosphatase [Ferrimonas balearica]
MRPAVFLDRDGVINRDTGYVGFIEECEILPGVVDACRRLVEAGFALVIVTNQSGIARQLYSESDFQTLTAWMKQQFQDGGVNLTEVYHCPHHPDFDAPDTQCDCRKPKPGMLLRGAREHHIDLSSSYLVGDRISDMQAGQAAGVKATLMVGELRHAHQEMDWKGEDLPAAVEWILKDSQKMAN